MEDCPLYGQSIYKTNINLIQDVSGYTKPHICSSKEENKCKTCEEQNIIITFQKNYFNNNLDHSSVESRILVDEDYINVKKSQIIETDTKEDKQNYTSSQTIHCSQSKDSTVELVCNNFLNKFEYSNFSFLMKSVQISKNEHLTESIEGKQSGITDFNQLNKMFNQLTGNKSPECILSNYLLFKKQNEKVINYQDGESSTQFDNDQHTEIKSTNHLLTKKQIKDTNGTESNTNGSESLQDGYKSSEFQLSDYLLFRNKPSKEECIIEMNNAKSDNKEIQCNQMSNDFMMENDEILSNSSNEERMIMDNDATQKNKFLDENEKINNKSKNASFQIIVDKNLDDSSYSKYSISEQQFKINSDSKEAEKNNNDHVYNNQSHSTAATHVLNTDLNNSEFVDYSLIEKKLEICRNDENEKIQNNCFEEVDDDDKENKEKSVEENTNENKKKKDSVGSISLKNVNHLTKQAKRINNIEFSIKENDSQIKLINIENEEENTEIKNNDMDTQKIKQNKKKRKKRKVQMYEDDNLEKKSLKRRKPNKDWSHIVTLPGNPATYKCTICEKEFKNLRCKCYHVACLLGKAPFQCIFCNRTFVKRSHFEYHERMHTGNKPFRCTLCDKCFVQKNKLNRHLVIHKQYNDVECGECGKKFCSKQYLKNHMSIHSKTLFKCRFCPKTYTLEPNRKRHERSHSSDRPFKCDICSKDFKSKFLLTRHRRIHEKSKPYSCDHCSRVFMSKFEVQRHITSHSDSKPYACELCSLKFRRKDNLKRHVKHHHTQYNDNSLASVKKATPNNEKNKKQLINNEKQVNDIKSKIGKNKMDNMLENCSKFNKVKEKSIISSNLISKPKRTSKSNLILNVKDSLKEFQPSQTSHQAVCLQINSESNHTGVAFERQFESKNPTTANSGPISITTFTEVSRVTGGKFIQTIPLEETLVLNRKIEEKIYTQNSNYIYPNLIRRLNTSPLGGKESFTADSISNTEIGFTSNHIKERSKTGYMNKEKQTDTKMNNEKTIVKDINIHWRRRTAESLKSKD